GVRVLGLDRFPTAHDRGSSHGATRIIRQAYFEHPDYVPLLLRAYGLWRELESVSGRKLMKICGLILAGPPSGEVVSGAKLAARLHGVSVEDVSARDFAGERAARFPGFRMPQGFAAVFEPAGGYLHVEDCVQTHIELALATGAEHRSDETIVSWESNGRTVRVRTESDEYEAAALILTPGAWASGLLQSLPEFPQLTVLRKTLHWHHVRSSVYDVSNGGTGFLFEMPGATIYGFPSLDGQTLKVAEHSGGETVSDPLHVDRTLKESDTQPIRHFLEEVMPDVDPACDHHAVCMYTMTPDGHFVVDRHSQHANVFYGAGFSGHGFKFTSVLGEALAELAIDGATKLPISFLSAGRFAL
ncbi:MAG: N-methyl-L-tryptophan oxidase, partial [Planctomycetota bacterium]|nr:N-methyl-L-tryptophan oxidase [Planctomycetota bacterium]